MSLHIIDCYYCQGKNHATIQKKLAICNKFRFYSSWNITELNDSLQSIILNEAKRNQSLASGLGLNEVKFNILKTYPENCDDEQGKLEMISMNRRTCKWRIPWLFAMLVRKSYEEWKVKGFLK